jgi:methionine synthase I (cobalamin-dependent)
MRDSGVGGLVEVVDRLQTILPHLNVLGGCCGTDHRHVAAICRSVTLH